MALAIRANIAKSRQTDPSAFPDYAFREYPKVMHDRTGRPIVENPVYLMTTPKYDHEDPQKVIRNGHPVVIGGDYAVVHSQDEEDEFLERHPEAVKSVVIDFTPNAARLAQINAENAEMEKALAKRAQLKALLGDHPAPAEPKKKRGRPSKKAAAAQSFEEFTGKTEAEPE